MTLLPPPPGNAPLLLFADLDGTLIVEPLGVGPSLVELIDLVQASGGALIPTSARPVPHLATMLHRHLPDSFAIGSGGAVIARLAADGSFATVHEETLEPTSGTALLDRLWEWHGQGRGMVFLFHGSQAQFEVGVATGTCTLGPDDLARIVGNRPVRHLEGRPSRSQRLLGISLLAPCEPERIRLLHSGLPLPDGWRAATYPEYRVPGWSWLELLPGKANKAAACRHVIRLWSEDHAEKPATMAVGDAPDDVGMFGLVESSYCPADASEAARLAASKILPVPGGDRFAAALATALAS